MRVQPAEARSTRTDPGCICGHGQTGDVGGSAGLRVLVCMRVSTTGARAVHIRCASSNVHGVNIQRVRLRLRVCGSVCGVQTLCKCHVSRAIGLDISKLQYSSRSTQSCRRFTHFQGVCWDAVLVRSVVDKLTSQCLNVIAGRLSTGVFAVCRPEWRHVCGTAYISESGVHSQGVVCGR
jgi:hypothetical protein